MKNNIKTLVAAAIMMAAPIYANAKQWSLKECIDYALENNISLQKTRLQKESAIEDIKQSTSALLPSLSFSSSQNVTYRPWPESNRATVANGYVETSVDKVYYNGSSDYVVKRFWLDGKSETLTYDFPFEPYVADSYMENVYSVTTDQVLQNFYSTDDLVGYTEPTTPTFLPLARYFAQSSAV